MQALDGGLYGTTSSGGEHGNGTFFRIGATAPTTTTLYTVPASAGFLQPVYLIAVVAPVAPSIGVPTGEVEFFDGNILIGRGTLSAGIAYVAAGGLAAGTHAITARYTGSGNYAPDASAPATVTVQPPAVSSFSFLIPLTNPQAVGQPVVLAALVVRLGAGADTDRFGSVPRRRRGDRDGGARSKRRRGVQHDYHWGRHASDGRPLPGQRHVVAEHLALRVADGLCRRAAGLDDDRADFVTGIPVRPGDTDGTRHRCLVRHGGVLLRWVAARSRRQI